MENCKAWLYFMVMLQFIVTSGHFSSHSLCVEQKFPHSFESKVLMTVKTFERMKILMI